MEKEAFEDVDADDFLRKIVEGSEDSAAWSRRSSPGAASLVGDSGVEGLMMLMVGKGGLEIISASLVVVW